MEDKTASTISGVVNDDAITVKIGRDEYIIDQWDINAMKGLVLFANNAFKGYGDERESEMCNAFELLVSNFLGLIVSSAENDKERILKQIK